MENRQFERRALIAMSGGVDSSVAAALMVQDGFDCMGATMKLYDEEARFACREKSCCTLADVEDARSVAFQLGMPYHVFNYKADFEQEVIARFISAYERGETPNPCIDCNRYMKFAHLYEHAKMLGYEYVVTGHYARICYDEARGRWLLKKGLDAAKDQSYVLYALTQEQLAHTKFPLGGYEKAEIRSIAQEYGFVNAKKRESQDICFVPDGDYAAFIRRHTGKDYGSGDFVDAQGKVLGQHKGIIGYTIGQRRGLGIAAEQPLYVVKKDMERNEVVLGGADALFGTELIAHDFNWISMEAPKESIRVTARTRYHQKEIPARASVNADGSVRVVFEQPVRAIAAGQAVVLYDGDIVVGGGTIGSQQS